MKKITIIGAGLAGTLLSLYLARRGYEVDVFEARGDIRKLTADNGRSINLALSCRGITGLAGMGLMADVNKILVPMRARAIHEMDGEITYQAFGRHQDEYINAVMRTDLNSLLLNKADSYPAIHLHFNMKLLQLDVHVQELHFEQLDGTQYTQPYQHLIGADGAGSFVRETLQKEQLINYTR